MSRRTARRPEKKTSSLPVAFGAGGAVVGLVVAMVVMSSNSSSTSEATVEPAPTASAAPAVTSKQAPEPVITARPKPAPTASAREVENQRGAESWAEVTDMFKRVLWLALEQQLESDWELFAENEMGRSFRDALGQKIYRAEGDPVAMTQLILRPEWHALLGEGGYDALIAEADAFPHSLRGSEAWKTWQNDALPKLEAMQRRTKNYSEAVEDLEVAWQAYDHRRAKLVFEEINGGDDPWAKAMLRYLNSDQIKQAFSGKAARKAQDQNRPPEPSERDF